MKKKGVKNLEERIKNILLYAGAEQSEYQKVRGKIAAADRIMVQVLSGLAAVLISGMFISALFVNGVAMNQIVYGFGSVVSLALFIASICLKQTYLVMPMVYLSYSIYYLYGIMIGAVTDPDEKTVTFMVLLVFLPALFVGRPLYSVIVTTLHILIFINLCFMHKSGSVLSNDIIDAIAFGLLGIISGTIISCVKMRGYRLEEKLTATNIKLRDANLQLRDATRTDVLTKMQNRNAYERDLYQISRRCNDSLGCVYIDVNGLKHLNDNYGHEQGDVMLKIVADLIKKHFGSEFSYRIGGDEFIVFVPDPRRNEIGRKADALSTDVEARNYHVAIGWKIHDLPDLSMKDLIEEAERFMFEKKVQFYKQADFDRRRH